MTDITTNFSALIKERSSGNASLVSSLQEQKLYAQEIAILRQDIDFLLRISYLLTIGDRAERIALMEAMIKGQEWKTGKKSITDASMAAIVKDYNKWISELYDFGTLFDHITDHHDFKTADPLASLPSVPKTTIKYYLSTHHQFPYDMDLNFTNVLAYLPKVATKVSNNLKRYLVDLENNRQH
jgi:hypothetical protein